MSGNHGFDDELRAWLEQDGPQDVPQRVVDRALQDAAGVRRARPLPGMVASALDGVALLRGGRQGRLAWAWTTLMVVLLTLAAAAVIVAGVVLINGERRAANGPIAFEMGGDIWVTEAVAGTEPRRLTDTPGVEEGNPVWSPDGSRLAYWVTEGARSTIHITDPGGLSRIVLDAPEGMVLPFDAAIFGWSPDGTKLAAPARGSVTEDGITRLNVESVVVFVVGAGSSERVPVDEGAWSFGWSPDGSSLGIVSATGVHVLSEADGGMTSVGGAEVLDDVQGLREAPPRFSRDGRSIVFTAGAVTEGGTSAPGRSDQDIHVVAIGDGEAATLVGGSANDLAAVVSPDGRRIAFGRSSAETFGGAFDFQDRTRSEIADLGSVLMVADAGGGSAVEIASGVWPAAQWSPDGERVLARSFDGAELLVIDPDEPAEPLRLRVATDSAPLGGFSWGARSPP